MVITFNSDVRFRRITYRGARKGTKEGREVRGDMQYTNKHPIMKGNDRDKENAQTEFTS